MKSPIAVLARPLWLLSFLTCGCQAAPPAPVDDEAAGIAIHVRGLPPGYRIVFARDRDQFHAPEEFISSTYQYRKETSFLGSPEIWYCALNVPPGRYAVVAACSTSLSSGGGSIPQFRSINRDWTFFPREMIEKSIVEVPAGSFRFAGCYELDLEKWKEGEQEGDELQRAYRAVLCPLGPQGGWFSSNSTTLWIATQMEEPTEHAGEEKLEAELRAAGWTIEREP